jgi:transcriptional regulator with XRE-family HTH domain
VNDTIGARLRVLRRWRGMTQAQVADLAGLSPALLSMIENGQRPLDRRSYISALAVALRVSETDLVGGPHLSADRLQADPHMAIPALRTALQTNTLTRPAVDQARPLAELHRQVFDRIEPLRRSCDYAGLGELLPPVIDELYRHIADPADESAQQMALETLVEACAIASAVARGLNYMDLAFLAAQRAEDAAVLLSDPLQKGKADFTLLHALPRTGSWQRNLAAAEQAAEDLEPHATGPLARQVLGMITLTASLSAAALQQGDTASHWLDEAADIARHVPDDAVRNWKSFSSTNVAIWRVTVGVERGESGGTMLELADHVTPGMLEATPSGRRAALFADVGRGLAREPKTRADAVRWLRRAEKAAPQRIRNSPPAREAVAYLLSRTRADAGGRELRGMAARMGVPH